MNFRKIYEQAKLQEKYGKQRRKKSCRSLRESITEETVQDTINELHEIIYYDECSIEVFNSIKRAQRMLFLLGKEIGMDVFLSPIECNDD